MANEDDSGGGAGLSIPHTTKGFKVDSDALKSVAKLVEDLYDDLTGNTGYPGNLKRYTEEGKGDVLGDTNSGLGKVYGSADNIFKTSYADVYDGVQKTYASMQQQLKTLATTCRTTAEKYEHHDDQATTDVTQSGPEI